MASLTQWTWVSDGQGGLARCSPWGHKESDTTEELNWTELNWTYSLRRRQFFTFFWPSRKLEDIPNPEVIRGDELMIAMNIHPEKAMSPHSNTLAWKIPGMGSHRVVHDWSDLAVAVAINIYQCSLVAQTVRNLPAMQETQIRSLGREDPLENGRTILSIILA